MPDLTPDDSRWFAHRLLNWFDHYGRKDLPWQQAISAYRVWVSEIMLQQTQVATVIPYYERFIKRFPDIQTLARAGADEVLHHWSGLGYYARARNLHKTAKRVVDSHHADFPEAIETMIDLPGIGRSTAGAILAIAHHQRHPILDGNVKRVLTRFHAVDGWPGKAAVQNILWEIAATYTPDERVADYTQAIMDLGATVCTRSKPGCGHCPLNEKCTAFERGKPMDFPVKRPKRDLPVRALHMLMLVRDNEVLLQQRPPTGIWGGLWAFPEFSSLESLCDYCERFQLSAGEIQQWPGLRHTLSHFHMDITPCLLTVDNPMNSVMEAGNSIWYKRSKPVEIGLAAPVQKLLEGMHTQERLI
ncbi:MAG: A/G-specific adenine glycosylase [Gammaproteobacteria bacterium]